MGSRPTEKSGTVGRVDSLLDRARHSRFLVRHRELSPALPYGIDTDCG